eukprot:TRINITY_DN1113_c0_g3_i1.p1 TRINITY_DN1113_c0_g3~~TRINITY_DN1113_c0_g3_i1.p1  ORF type:complete len:190 (-),score=54.23 TRINITY_DN1113_c0_g3_i1:135-704(-)
MGVLLDDEKAAKSSEKGEDQNYKELFSKGTEALNQVIDDHSFKPIHTEARRVVAMLTGKAEAKPEAKTKLPGAKVADLLEGLDDFGSEEQKASSKEESSSNKSPLEGFTFDLPTKQEVERKDKKLFENLVVKPGPVPVVKKPGMGLFDGPGLSLGEVKSEAKKTSSPDTQKQPSSLKKDTFDILDVDFN